MVGAPLEGGGWGGWKTIKAMGRVQSCKQQSDMYRVMISNDHSGCRIKNGFQGSKTECGKTMVQTQDVYIARTWGRGNRSRYKKCVVGTGGGVNEWEKSRMTHFAYMETEAQRDFTAHLRSGSSAAVEAGLKPEFV